MRLFAKVIRWGIAAILSFIGISMIIGFIAGLIEGGSKEPLWFDFLLVTVVGFVPLGGGIMLFTLKGSRPPQQQDDS